MSTHKDLTTTKISKKNLSLIRIFSETSGNTKDEVIYKALELLYKKNNVHDLFNNLIEISENKD